MPLPAWVAEHDELLEEQPLIGYGLATSKELGGMAAMGAPQPL